MKKSVTINKDQKAATSAKRALPQWVWMIAILLLTIIAFSPTFDNELTNWDDGKYITTNTLIESLSFDNIVTIFKTPEVMGNYHPLTIVSLAVDYYFFQLSPGGYHVHALLLHLLSICIVFILIQALFKQSFITIVTTVLFAIHPLRVESVAWVSERKDQLYVMYYLAGLLVYLYYIDKKKAYYLALTVLFFVLSLLSKAQAVTFPLALFIIDYIREKKVTLQSVLLKTPLLVLSILIGILAIQAQKASAAITPIESHNLPEHLLFACYGLAQYVLKLILPVNLAALYPYPTPTNGHYEATIYICLLAPVVFAAAVWYFRRQRIIVSGILFFLLNIILLLQILPVGSAVISDRYTYLSGLGFFWIAAYGIYHITLKYTAQKNMIISACCIYVLWLSYSCYSRTLVWHDDETLWRNEIEQFQSSPIPYNNLAGYYKLHNDFTTSKYYLDKALALKPMDAKFRANRCWLYLKLGNLDSALIDGRLAVHIDSTYRDARQNRGMCYVMARRPDSAIIDFNWLVTHFSTEADIYNNRGNINTMLNKFATAINDFTHAIALDSSNWNYYGNRAVAYYRNQQYPDAIKDADIAIIHLPTNSSYIYTRGQAYYALGDYTHALPDFITAQQMGLKVNQEHLADIQKHHARM